MSWREQAACRGVGPDLFFPERGEVTDAAKAVCAGCPVQAECLQFALDTVERVGIWGGLSERERRAMRPDEPRKCKKCDAPTPGQRHLYCEACKVVARQAADQRGQVLTAEGGSCVRCGMTLHGGRSLGSSALCGGWACERAERRDRLAIVLGEAS